MHTLHNILYKMKKKKKRKNKYGTFVFSIPYECVLCTYITYNVDAVALLILLFANDFVILRRRVAQDEYTVIYDRILVFCVSLYERVRVRTHTHSCAHIHLSCSH